jgi:hypothetical protein
LIGGAVLTARPILAPCPRTLPATFEPTPLPAWSIYKLAAKRQWLGIVEAPDATAAIEAAAKKFKMDARRLLAVWQR